MRKATLALSGLALATASGGGGASAAAARGSFTMEAASVGTPTDADFRLPATPR